ncbi:MAG: hypothetical protein ACRCXQ_07210, partial [Vagococcus fluvialis]
EIERKIKSLLKRQVKITAATIVAFLITGTVSFSMEIPTEKLIKIIDEQLSSEDFSSEEELIEKAKKIYMKQNKIKEKPEIESSLKAKEELLDIAIEISKDPQNKNISKEEIKVKAEEIYQKKVNFSISAEGNYSNSTDYIKKSDEKLVREFKPKRSTNEIIEKENQKIKIDKDLLEQKINSSDIAKVIEKDIKKDIQINNTKTEVGPKDIKYGLTVKNIDDKNVVTKNRDSYVFGSRGGTIFKDDTSNKSAPGAQGAEGAFDAGLGGIGGNGADNLTKTIGGGSLEATNNSKIVAKGATGGNGGKGGLGGRDRKDDKPYIPGQGGQGGRGGQGGEVKGAEIGINSSNLDANSTIVVTGGTGGNGGDGGHGGFAATGGGYGAGGHGGMGGQGGTAIGINVNGSNNTINNIGNIQVKGGQGGNGGNGGESMSQPDVGPPQHNNGGNGGTGGTAIGINLNGVSNSFTNKGVVIANGGNGGTGGSTTWNGFNGSVGNKGIGIGIQGNNSNIANKGIVFGTTSAISGNNNTV